jgi:two-component system, chemotaxis family, sensor kinase CheA
MIDTEILQDYSAEARELLDEMENSLIRLEEEGKSPELLDTIFRAAHSIKGSAEYIGLERTSTLTHGLETLLDRVRAGAMELTPELMEFLFRAKDRIAALIVEVTEFRKEQSDISTLMSELSSFLAGEMPEGPTIAGSIEPEPFLAATGDPELDEEEDIPVSETDTGEIISEVERMIDDEFQVDDFQAMPDSEDISEHVTDSGESDIFGDAEYLGPGVEADEAEFGAASDEASVEESIGRRGFGFDGRGPLYPGLGTGGLG